MRFRSSTGVLSLVVAATASLVAGPSAPAEGVSGTAVVHGGGKQLLPAESFTEQLPQFTQRTVTERGALEPPVAFGSDGALWYPSWVNGDYYPVDAATVLFRSVDGGRTWTDVTPQTAGVPFNDRGGDPILYRDGVTGRLFYLLYFASCAHIAWTDDGGLTWGRPLQGPVCEPGGVTDYPKLWTSRPVSRDTTPAGAPFYVHLCYNALYRLSCQRSIDGGLTFLPAPSPDPESGINYHLNTCWSFHASWTVSSVRDGTIYMPRPYCDNLEVAISRDNGLSWERSVVAAYPSAAGTEFGSDTRLAMDADGNLYYMWISKSWYIGDGESPFLSISRDGGVSWSAPIDAGVPGLTAAKFPSIVAGATGRIAFMYLGSKVPGGFGAGAGAMETATWDAYAGFSVNALDADPVFATTTANPVDDPLRKGPCDGRCTPNPGDCIYDCSIGSARVGMFDYLEMALDPVSGTVAASLVDLCLPGCTADGSAFVGAVGVQTAGPRLG